MHMTFIVHSCRTRIRPSGWINRIRKGIFERFDKEALAPVGAALGRIVLWHC